MTLLIALSLLSLVLWIGLSLDRRRAWPAALTLDPAAPPSQEQVVAIVPARDEESVIGHSVASLARQRHDRLAIVVVDDGSSDGTAEEVERLIESRADREIVLVRSGERPDGWSGKVHAMASGVSFAEHRFADAEWWLFTDADIEHSAYSIAAMLDVARRQKRDLVSVMARLHAESLAERLIVPPFVWFFHLLYPFRSVANPESRVAAAAGGCVLIRRQALERAGGLEIMRDALIDDVALARAVKRSGGRLWLGLDPGIVSIREYPELGSLWRMVSRSAFVQLRYRWDWLAGVVVGLAGGFVAPPFLLVAGGLAAGHGAVLEGALVSLVGLCAWGLQTRALLPAVRHHGVPAWWAVSLPLSAALYGAMTVSSALDHLRGRSSTWKGRVYARGVAEARGEDLEGNEN